MEITTRFERQGYQSRQVETFEALPHYGRAPSSLKELLELSFNDPYFFVYNAFDWRSLGLDEPTQWQQYILLKIRDKLLADAKALKMGEETGDKAKIIQGQSPLLVAVAAAHGVGKSAIACMLIYWAFVTRPLLRGIITANTEKQLLNRLGAELYHWLDALLPDIKKGIKKTQTKLAVVGEAERWLIESVNWSKEGGKVNESVAGLHAKHVLTVYDEASGIPDEIWNATAGTMTTPKAFHFVFGNPLRNTGMFRNCFLEKSKGWITHQVSAFDSPETTTEAYIQEMRSRYGEHSLEYRTRVYGLFPESDENQWIDDEEIYGAVARSVPPDKESPIILGVDVARFGRNLSVIVCRQGRHVFKDIRTFRKIDGWELANEVIRAKEDFGAHFIFIDGTGVGASPTDILKNRGLRGCLKDIHTGKESKNKFVYKNKRSEIWGRLKDEMPNLDLPDNSQLIQELREQKYKTTPNNLIIMLPKEEAIKAGGVSPDIADALCMTFADDVFLPSQAGSIYGGFSSVNRETLTHIVTNPNNNSWMS